ncbi:hypothetical protein B0T26DRAFT_790998 [Lasiosphaeria miniovina]|uniref:Uncharacterized protein n=1 Tax=Lasiosphaeria miniovina TaxID=1954250 RepID=A0AA40A0J8_9PEZI|nr:uncharacterized protein B0T26DRAFT_790998 [Lasiosphaeria miniovina]KAK0707101.1 hypothetical protein B0T26DRAFT_790998 [Lasiosphaeria miniovina]
MPSANDSMPIAIVGIACRFPGDASNPERFWDMLAAGKSALSEVPKDRFNIDAFYHPNPERHGAFNTRSGNFMKSDVIGFDAPFFSITAKEAHAMDPQQRIALELTYEGLENAGIRIQDVAGSDTGCYMACFAHDYLRLRSHDPEDFPLYEGTGNGQPLLANRVSWYFDLKGPSLALDTACSSSLVALHLACQSIRSGETTSAIVGGANIVFMPELAMALSSLHFLSPDARSKAFDASANGYARGEGAAVVVLKSLDAALRDGNVIRAVIRGTGVNQDGRTPGITVPSARSQEELIRSTYASAGLDFRDTQYFEAHGTGTPVGDPLECSAIGATFGQSRTPEQPTILVGSVKTNIGHLEAAAGLAGLIKAVYCVEKGQIPANLWFEKPNPRIDMEVWKLKIPTQLVPWPTKGLRRASINSFGYGGTNGHCIIDDAYHYLKAQGLRGAHSTAVPKAARAAHSLDNSSAVLETKPPDSKPVAVHVVEIENGSETSDALSTSPSAGSESDETPESVVLHVQSILSTSDINREEKPVTTQTATATATATKTSEELAISTRSPRLLVWSSHEQKGTDKRAAALAAYLDSHATADEEDEQALLDRLAFTLSNKRSQFQWRSFAVASSVAAARAALAKPRKPVRASSDAPPVLGFVFTGQGAQWYAMGRELLAYTVYRESVEAAAKHIKALGAEWDLVDELMADKASSRVGEPTISQPACTALQVALVDLLANWNIRPSVVTGHSSGEIAAAYAKGAISREDAWMIAFHRGRLSTAITQEGAMLAVGLGDNAARVRIKQMQDGAASGTGHVVVACINSPSSVTVSGDVALIAKLQAVLDADKVFNRRLDVQRAYHSPHMAGIADAYLGAMQGLTRPAPDTSSPPAVAMFSSVTGALVDAATLASPAYWVSNLVSPVQFSGALQAALDHTPGGGGKRRTTAARKAGRVDALVEIGPHAGLQGPIKQVLAARAAGKAAAVPYVSVLLRNSDARHTALEALGALVQLGYGGADVARANRPSTKEGQAVDMLTDMAPVAWNRSTRYWHEAPATKAFRFRARPRHDLLGARSEFSSGAEPSWRNYLRVAELPWLDDHQVQASLLYPFAGMLVMAVEAARQVAEDQNPEGGREVEGFRLRHISAGAALVIPHDGAGGREGSIETKLQLRPWRAGSKTLDFAWHEFTIACRNAEGSWTQNCAGLVAVQYRAAASSVFVDETAADMARHRAEYERLVDAKLPEVPIREFYAFLDKLGVQLGPSFQTLSRVGSGHYEAHCELTVSDTAALMPENYEHEHVIHPATLDGVVQMAALAATAGGLTVDRAKIPRFIDSVYVSARVAAKKPGDTMVGYARSKPQGHHEFVGTAVVSDAAWSEPLVVIEGCRTVALESLDGEQQQQQQQQHDTAVENLTKMGARHRWDVDAELTPPAAVAAQLLRAVENIPDAAQDDVRDLEHASFIICKRATQTLTAAARGSLAPHHKLLVAFMEQQVARAGRHELDCQPRPDSHDGSDWLSCSPSDDDAVLARVGSASVDGELLARVAAHLPGILAGSVEPLQVLREDGLLTAYYRRALGTARIQGVLGAYARLLAHKRPLRVLEVGAGTGGTTAVVLAALGRTAGEAGNRLVEYVFTDVSSGFFEAAAAEFEEWAPFLDFRVLDIEKDPTAQGFAVGAYDLVVASNVLHATSRLADTLKHCRALLRPGGVLMLEEITSSLARVPMVVGSLPGWWSGENDGRKGGPLISEARWDEQLRAQGFGGIDLCFRDTATAPSLKSLMLAVAAPAPALPPPPRHVVVVKSNTADTAVASLVAQISHALQAQAGDTVSIQELTLAEAATASLAGKACIVALEAHTPFMAHLAAEADFNAIKHVVLAAGSTLWLTRGGAVDAPTPEANVMVGLARTIRGENPSVRIATLDLDSADTDSASTAAAVAHVFRAADAAANTEFEFALRAGRVLVPRLHSDPELSSLFAKPAAAAPSAPDSNSPVSPPVHKQPTIKLLPLNPSPPHEAPLSLALDIATPGMLNTLHFAPDTSPSTPLAPHDVEIRVQAVPLNFHDVMFAMGHADTSMAGDDDGLGVECAGTVSRVGSAVKRFVPGDRAVTCRIGCWRTFARQHEDAVQQVPDGVGLVEAASFASVYCAALYSLVDVARLRPGETVLVHAAAGGFGQAAVAVARDLLGAGEVFVSVGSERKKRFVVEELGVKAENVLNSRDAGSFAAGIKRLTGGRGVDVVLNSLAGEALRESWACLAPFGRFVELGKKDMFGNSGLDMAPFLHNTTFAGVNMGAVFNHNIPLAARLLADVMRYHAQGVVKPLRPLTVMSFAQIEAAFRTMQAGKHIGKLVLVPHDDDLVPMIPPPPRPKPALALRPDATYLLPGGLGGLGRSLASWMAARGARHLVFTSRSGAQSLEAQALLKALDEQGVRAKAFACDIGDAAEFKRVLADVESGGFPAITGAVTFAMQIQDVFFENMTIQDFGAAVRPKVEITRNLDALLPKDLDFFICMSSVAGVVGSRGQGNYNAGNTYQDAMARRRRAQGLNATSICLGIVQDVGFAADKGVVEQHRYLDKGAAIYLTEADVLTAIEAAMAPSPPAIDDAEAVLGLATGGLLQAGNHEEPYWFPEARFAPVRVYDTQVQQAKSYYQHVGGSAGGSGGRGATGEETRVALAAAASADEAAAVALGALTRKLARAMMMDEADLDPESPANSYGIDSLVAVEIRAWVFKELRSEVSVFEILSNASLASLAAIVAARSSVVRSGIAAKGEDE